MTRSTFWIYGSCDRVSGRPIAAMIAPRTTVMSPSSSAPESSSKVDPCCRLPKRKALMCFGNDAVGEVSEPPSEIWVVWAAMAEEIAQHIDHDLGPCLDLRRRVEGVGKLIAVSLNFFVVKVAVRRLEPVLDGTPSAEADTC